MRCSRLETSRWLPALSRTTKTGDRVMTRTTCLGTTRGAELPTQPLHPPKPTLYPKPQATAATNASNHSEFRMDLHPVGGGSFSVSGSFGYLHALLAPAMLAIVGVAISMGMLHHTVIGAPTKRLVPY